MEQKQDVKQEYDGGCERIERDGDVEENRNGEWKIRRNHQKNLVIDIDDIWEYIV